jgi:hypothetical protein
MTKIEAPKTAPPATPRTDFGKKVQAHVRYRNAAGAIVPGATTILNGLAKPALVGWANKLGLEGIDSRSYTSEAASVGTLAHYLIECQLGLSEPDLTDFTPAQLERAQTSLASFNAWLVGHELKPLMLEAQLVSEQYGYGGTIDCYATLDGVPTLLDFKTSSGIYEEHKFQVASYQRLLVEHEYDVQGVRILRIGRDGGGLEEHRLTGEECLAAWKVFQAALVLYRAKQEFKAGAKVAAAPEAAA